MLNIAVSIADAGSYLYEGEYVTAFTMLGVGMIPGGKLGMKIVGSGFRATRNNPVVKNAFAAKDINGNMKLCSVLKMDWNIGKINK